MSEPAAPMYDVQLAPLLAAWQSGLHTVSGLGRALSAEQWQLPTECPGWSAGDVVRHLCWVEAMLAGRPTPEHEPDWARLPHVTGDFARRTEVGVDVRRSDPPAQTCDELDELTEVRMSQLMALESLSLDSSVPGLWGKPVRLEQLLRVRCFDIWTHEQDIRRAVGSPGNLDSPGARASAAQLVAALPFILAKTLGAEPGESLHVAVTGAVAFECTATVGPDGRAALGPPPDAAAATVALTTDWETYARLGAGRLRLSDPATASRVQLVGTSPWADRVIAALAVTP